MTLVERQIINDFIVADTNTLAVLRVPVGATKFTAQIAGTTAELGSALTVAARWSVIGDDKNVTRVWSDFGTSVCLRDSTDFAAYNVDLAADFLVFEVTTAGDGTANVARVYVNFYTRPGGP